MAQPGSIAEQKFVMRINGNTLKIPCFSNFPIASPREDISKAVITIHGINRDADAYFDDMVAAAALRPDDSDSTLIIAPQFLTTDDINAFGLDAEHLYWSEGGWVVGSNSQDQTTHPRPVRLPSYAVLDSLLLRLAHTFPKLRQLIVAGHSAGGQLSNRYAATTPVELTLCADRGISTRFIVANPGSFLYVDNRRRSAGSLDQFAVPSTTCTGYNDWRYGLDNMFTYPASIGKDSIISRLGRREIIYLNGAIDNNPNAPGMDKSCAADLQGAHRLERGTIYFNYLHDYYGDALTSLQEREVIPGAGHDDLAMYSSQAGLFFLFEKSPQSGCDVLTATREPPRVPGFTLFPNPATDHLIVESAGEPGHLTLFALDGRKVRVVRMVDRGLRLDLGEISSGIYLLEFRSSEGRATKKIMIHRPGF